MRTTIFVILIILALASFGCAQNAQNTQNGFNVILSDAVMNRTDTVDGKATDRIDVMMTNKEDFPLNCTITTDVSNSTNQTAYNTVVQIGAKEEKKVLLKIEMLYGDSEMKITRECEKA